MSLQIQLNFVCQKNIEVYKMLFLANHKWSVTICHTKMKPKCNQKDYFNENVISQSNVRGFYIIFSGEAIFTSNVKHQSCFFFVFF